MIRRMHLRAVLSEKMSAAPIEVILDYKLVYLFAVVDSEEFAFELK